MTRTPIPNCPQPETPIRDRAWTDEQRPAEPKYSDAEIEAMIKQLAIVNLVSTEHKASDMLRSLLAERIASRPSTPDKAGVSDADVESGLEMMFGVTGKDADVYRPGMRAALTNFAKGVEVGGDVEDAARYRWLRRNHNADLLAEDVIDEAIQVERHE